MRAGWWGAVPPTDRAPGDPRPVTSDRALRLIALFKFGKAALLVLITAGALGLVRPAMAAHAEQAITALAASGNHRLLPEVLTRLLRPAATPTRGIRRWRISICRSVSRRRGRPRRGRRWGEYLTVIATASLVPLELWELSRRLTTVRVLALVLNLLIVAYLIARLRRRRPSIRATAA